jgi:hypothetical protein
MLSGKDRAGNDSVGDRTEAIRQDMLECLGESARVAFPVVERKVRFAQDARDLWYLRAEVMAALSAMKGERAAQQAVASFSGKFSGLLPSSFSNRSSRV